MSELAVTSASANLAFLILYGAAVIFTLERIADRFGQGLSQRFVLRSVGHWFLLMSFLVLAGLVVVALPNDPAKIPLSLALFIIGAATVSIACYRTWAAGSDVRRMLSLALSTPGSTLAVREILWRAIERGDVRAVGLSLRAFDKASTGRVAVLAWLLGHRVLEGRDWLTTEILAAELEHGLDEAAAECVRETLVSVLESALRREQFELVYQVINETMKGLEAAVPFTNNHGNLMDYLAWTTWLVGDYRGSARRTASVPAQLNYVQGIYSARQKDIWRAILERGDAAGVDVFISFVCRIAEETEETGSTFSLYTDILMDGVPTGIVTVKSLGDLANSMRYIRLREGGKAFRGETDEDGFTLGDPGKMWNDLFLLLVSEARKVGITEDEIEHLASTYGALGDPDLMRNVKGKKGKLGTV